MRAEGGCHCGAVRFAIEAPSEVELLDCNCSICAKTGYLHMIVVEGDFTLLAGQSELVEYRFGTHIAMHLFCRHCGLKPFYRPRSHPDAWSVNFRCLDPGHALKIEIRPYDGKQWEVARAALR